MGALAIDERQGDQWGWAVGYQTVAAAREAALRECGTGCSVVLTFDRCAAYAADQDADSTAVGWAEAYASGADARQAALSECGLRGGSGCMVRVWGCNGQVVEEGLGLDRSARRQIQQGLLAEDFDPGVVDGLFGPRTRSAIRRWQSARGRRATGYLDGASVEALRSVGGAGPAVAAAVATPGAAAAQPAAATATAEQEILAWQSIMNSGNPAEYEAYLVQFPNGVFSALAQVRLAALRAPASDSPAVAGNVVGAAESPTAGSRVSGSRVSGAPAPAFGTAAGGDVRRQPGDVFRDCEQCPEMVVLPGSDLALGRYEVTVEEYRAFVSATGRTGMDMWRRPTYPQTDRHPVVTLIWDDAQAYVSWLSRRTGAVYRLPSGAEWDRGAVGSQPGCYRARTNNPAPCPVGSYGSNALGLSDMVGNVWEWTADCDERECVLRGGSWNTSADYLRPSARFRLNPNYRDIVYGFRVLRTLD